MPTSARDPARRRGQKKTTYFRFENEQNKFLIRPASPRSQSVSIFCQLDRIGR